MSQTLTQLKVKVLGFREGGGGARVSSGPLEVEFSERNSPHLRLPSFHRVAATLPELYGTVYDHNRASTLGARSQVGQSLILCP